MLTDKFRISSNFNSIVALRMKNMLLVGRPQEKNIIRHISRLLQNNNFKIQYVVN